MRKRTEQGRRAARGFFLGLCFTLLWQSGWAVFSLVLWLLHLWLGIPLYLSLITLGVWPLSALLATVLIHWGTGSAGAPAPAQENRNPYSADNAEVFLGIMDDMPGEGLPVRGEPAQTIVLIMRRRPVAQGLAQKLRGSPNIHLIFEPSYSRAQTTVCSRAVGAALIEVAESGGHHGISDCLALCARLREEAPQCKLLLMCPERDKAGVTRAVEEKRMGRIDDFVFYDSSIDYLASKLLAL